MYQETDSRETWESLRQKAVLDWRSERKLDARVESSGMKVSIRMGRRG
jgi:hypothetical protein